MQKVANILIWIVLLFPVSVAQGAPFQKVDIYTDSWPPYVLAEPGREGPAEATVRLVLNEAGYEPLFVKAHFFIITKLLREGTIPGAFPYYRTPQRERDFLFSRPLGNTRNRVYFDAWKWDGPPPSAEVLAQQKIGSVFGYSYGASIDALLQAHPDDRKTTYSSELRALQGLVQGEVDFLPMAVAVKDQLTHEYFPDYVHRVREVPGVGDTAFDAGATYHFVAPRTPEGRALISAFNAALDRLEANRITLQSRQKLPVPNPHHSGFVTIDATDNVPFVIGRDTKVVNSETRHYAIPVGSKGVILQWSSSIREGSRAPKNLFNTMNDYSQLRMVSGPHVDKELWVPNIHLQID